MHDILTETFGLVNMPDTYGIITTNDEYKRHDKANNDYSHYSSASKSSIPRFVITEKAPTWATTAFTFKTLLRHYAKRALTPLSLNVKLVLRRKGHKGWVG